MLDTKRDIPGQHWGDYQFVDHDYDSRAADPTVDVTTIPSLPRAVRIVNLGGYLGLSSDSRTAFAQLMGKTKLSTTGSDPMRGQAVPATDGRASTWLTDAMAAGYAVLLHGNSAQQQRAAVAMTRSPSVARQMASTGWIVAAAPDRVTKGMAGLGLLTLTLSKPTPVPTPPLLLSSSVQPPQQRSAPVPDLSFAPDIDALSQPIQRSDLITGIVAKTAVMPASPTADLFPVIASTQPKTIVSSSPTPMPRSSTPAYPPVPLPPTQPYVNQPVDVTALTSARTITGGRAPMPLPQIAPVDTSGGGAVLGPSGGGGIVAPTLPTMQTMQEGGDATPGDPAVACAETGGTWNGTACQMGGGGIEQPPSLGPSSNKTLYVVGGAVVLAGIGYYLYTKKGHTPNRRHRRRH